MIGVASRFAGVSGWTDAQIAALRPPALKAIITLCSTDDRYADDVHYKGGLVLGLDMLHWATYMLLANAEPPDPDVDPRYEDLWSSTETFELRDLFEEDEPD